ncbi:hypothetical protein RSOLAG1IB_01825 [Rhizoctonia solani AG-1 IB]|uniref:Uncharacterized protein n=1 Tax=Thanatephorus cucumeris (strain AG1-IB / isolate 7/3/14) TaxID=1108050 RepID=A0A0B7FHV9_THACB|nr:hypothetical protein RSOLAG1IB_01825 [Rhizoctonia solani AG-1 IB]
MSSLNHNIPDFAPPLNYRHKIDPNAAWVSSRPSSFAPAARGRSPPPPRILAPTTIWGTPVPNWKIDDQVLVQLYSPGGEWHQATVLAVFPPVEFETLSEAQLETLPPARLAKMTAQYTVKIVEGDNSAHIWNAVPERFIAPMVLAEKLRANVLKFAVSSISSFLEPT